MKGMDIDIVYIMISFCASVAAHLSQCSTCSKNQLVSFPTAARWTEMSHLHREITSFPYRSLSSYNVSSWIKKARCRIRREKEPREKERERATSSILPRKDPVRAWRRSGSHRCDLDSSSGIPWRYGT